MREVPTDGMLPLDEEAVPRGADLRPLLQERNTKFLPVAHRKEFFYEKKV